MKPGQLVMLIRTCELLPPSGAVGEIAGACSWGFLRIVRFQAYSNLRSCKRDGTYCVPAKWLMPIDDPDAVKKYDEAEGTDLTIQEAALMARRMLKDLEKEHG